MISSSEGDSDVLPVSRTMSEIDRITALERFSVKPLRRALRESVIKRLVDHLSSVGEPLRFNFNHHIEATQHGRIDVANRIGGPKRDDRIFFQKAVDFSLVGASAEKERSQVVEDVFGFVDHQKIGIGLRKDVARSLPKLQSRGSLLFLSRFLFGELHFVTGESQFLGNDTRKFRFAASGP